MSSPGDDFDNMYLIASGSVEVWKLGDAGERIPVINLYESDYFGEVAFFMHIKRTATVTALETTELMLFSRELLESLLERYPLVKKVLEGVAKKHDCS